MFLSRIELAEGASEQETFWRQVVNPYGAHQALWSVFGQGPGHRRDFLFRAEERLGRPSFLVLSAQRPEMPSDGLWEIETKPFAPVLRPGERLAFRLRASPVVRRSRKGPEGAKRRTQRHDVVMDRKVALKAQGKPAPPATTLVREAGLTWLRGQAQRAGFSLVEAEAERIGGDGLLESPTGGLEAVRVDEYRQHRIHRRGETPIRFSTVDFEGLLEVSAPELLLTRVAAGFGPQKAFGCGLMLLRRA